MVSLNFSMPRLVTERFNELTIDAVNQDEYVLIPHSASEQRAQILLWEQLREGGLRNHIVLTNIQADTICVSVNGSNAKVVSLRDQSALENILSDKKLLIDISGLPHHVWAPLLKAAYNIKIQTRILYAEPESYSPHDSPASSTLFDLSKEFGGLSPLPGFAQLSGPSNDEKCVFVALLGFEGNRPRSLIYNLDPMPKVIPIVGVPGFQVEFPSFTVKCNSELLDEFQAYYDIRYAKASCPFEIYKVLQDIKKDNPDCYMYVAPVGTKPHGLGAILYAIANPEDTEIMFDHPVRKAGRTKGVGITHIYDFGVFDGF